MLQLQRWVWHAKNETFFNNSNRSFEGYVLDTDGNVKSLSAVDIYKDPYSADNDWPNPVGPTEYTAVQPLPSSIPSMSIKKYLSSGPGSDSSIMGKYASGPQYPAADLFALK